jgi:AcrR family transcriptional regulator
VFECEDGGVSVVEPRTNADVWERKRVRTSLEIERAGLVLLAEHGVGNVTVEQAAAAAGISTRTFFRYFHNTRDVLSGVPIRESKRICQLIAKRPPHESLFDAVHAVFQTGGAAAELRGEDGQLELEAVELWTRVVRAAPEVVQVESRVTSTLAAELEHVVRDRLDLGTDDETVGVLAAAFAAVIWYVYTRLVRQPGDGNLSVHLDVAFTALSNVAAGRQSRAR